MELLLVEDFTQFALRTERVLYNTTSNMVEGKGRDANWIVFEKANNFNATHEASLGALKDQDVAIYCPAPHDRWCTIGRTMIQEAKVHLQIDDPSPADQGIIQAALDNRRTAADVEDEEREQIIEALEGMGMLFTRGAELLRKDRNG